MAKWRIVGAEKTTGEEVAIEVDAHDEASAELEANERGVLVAEMEEIHAVPLEYQAPTYPAEPVPRQPMPAIQDDPSQPPDYKEIRSGAETLDLLAALCTGLAVFAVFGALFAVMVAISRGSGVDLVVAIISGVLGFMLWIVAAAVLNMLASLARAHRDMVRNSYHWKK